MSKQEIKEIIVELLKKIAPDAAPEEINENENFRNELEMDSFDFLQLMVAIQEKLSIEIPEQDYASVSTIKNLIDYLVKKKG